MKYAPNVIASVSISHTTKKLKRKILTGTITKLVGGDYHFDPGFDSDIDEFYGIKDFRLNCYNDSVHIMGDLDFATIRRTYHDLKFAPNSFELSIDTGISKQEIADDGSIPSKVYDEINKIAHCVKESMQDAYDYARRAAALEEKQKSKSNK